jgi:putative transposase
MTHGSRIPPSAEIRKRIQELYEGIDLETQEQSSLGFKERAQELVKEWFMLMAQEMLEKEAEDFLGRGYYQRDKEKSGERGYRNGYEPNQVRTLHGKTEVQIPQVRGASEPFQSRIKAILKSDPGFLEGLSREFYLRGASTRDIADALETISGEKILSRSRVSEITETLWDEYETFSKRDLSKYEVIYLVMDAVYEPVRPYVKTNEAVLVAYGILSDGRKVLLSMTLGHKESYDCWLEFLRDMVNRGLNVPLSLTSDGAGGLIKAINEVFPISLRIRCWVHRMRNLSVKVPEYIWCRIKPEIVAIRESADYDEGKRKLDEFLDKHGRDIPTFCKCLADDSEALLNVLRLPYKHRKIVRSTNLVERVFVEERRRTKVIPQFLSEKSGLKLVFGVLYRASVRWRRVPMGPYEIEEVNRLREELGIKAPYEQAEKVPA